MHNKVVSFLDLTVAVLIFQQMTSQYHVLSLNAGYQIKSFFHESILSILYPITFQTVRLSVKKSSFLLHKQQLLLLKDVVMNFQWKQPVSTVHLHSYAMLQFV